MRPNPYQHASFWYWDDEDDNAHGPYHTQRDALRGLMKHIDPPWFTNLWTAIRGFLHDTRG
jgi:hypothetical protein